MDQPTSSPESTGGRSPSGSPPPAGQRQQGALGGRQVSEAPLQAPSIRDSRAAGTATGGVETRPGIHWRRATAGTSSRQAAVSVSGTRPCRRARMPEGPGDPSERASEVEAPQPVPTRARLGSTSGITELPWLTREQNEERQVLHSRLSAWRERSQTASQPRADVDEALDLVSRIERDLVRADELLQGMRTRLLTEAEWRELTFLVERARADTPHRLAMATDRLDGLAGIGAPSSAEAGQLKASLQRFVAAHEFLTAEELPWGDVVKRVEVPLGPDERTTAVVESRVIPGTAFGECLARGYPRDENSSLVDTVLSGRVPGLAQTTLTNATGQILFRGLRRGFIGPPTLHPQALRNLSDADLERLVSELVMVKNQGESTENYRRRVAAECRLIRSEGLEAYLAAEDVRYQASEWMADESAAAALCSDPDELQRAMGGETADIKLFDVSLFTQNDFTPWVSHHLWQARTLPPLRSLNLQGSDRALCQVSVKACVRQFALCVEHQGHNFSIRSGLTRGVVQLLGGMDSREPGGDLLARVDELRSRAAQLGRELAAGGQEQVRTLPPGALDQTGRLQARNRIDSLQAEMARLDRQARALEQAGRQLKDLWREHDGWPTGDEAYGAAARLALVAYLMGETPLLSCSTDRDYNKRLDAEVKILATVTDCRDGQVPPVDLDMDTWDPARTVFRKQ